MEMDLTPIPITKSWRSETLSDLWTIMGFWPPLLAFILSCDVLVYSTGTCSVSSYPTTYQTPGFLSPNRTYRDLWTYYNGVHLSILNIAYSQRSRLAAGARRVSIANSQISSKIPSKESVF